MTHEEHLYAAKRAESWPAIANSNSDKNWAILESGAFLGRDDEGIRKYKVAFSYITDSQYQVEV